MQDFLFNEFNLQVSVDTISCTLSRACWLRKAVRAYTAERSWELHILWIGRQAMWTADQLVFLNKSASNEGTGGRKCSWAPIGRECEVSHPFKRSER